MFQVYKYNVDFKLERNRRECLALAQVIDFLRAGERRSALESAVRRLGGVHTADSSDNNWAACDALELVLDKQSFVPGFAIRNTVKAVANIEALRKKESKPAKSSQRPPAGPPRDRGAAQGSHSMGGGNSNYGGHNAASKSAATGPPRK
jgi:hypothetical protein